MEKLRELWVAVASQGVSDTTIHALVSHAQDMEADRIAALLGQILEQPSQIDDIDGDIIVDVLRKTIESRSYRPKFGGG